MLAMEVTFSVRIEQVEVDEVAVSGQNVRVVGPR